MGSERIPKVQARIILDLSVDTPSLPIDIALQVTAETEADWILLQIWKKVGTTVFVDVLPSLAHLIPTPPESPKPTSFGAFG
jgi:hypothetical protein